MLYLQLPSCAITGSVKKLEIIEFNTRGEAPPGRRCISDWTWIPESNISNLLIFFIYNGDLRNINHTIAIRFEIFLTRHTSSKSMELKG